ncbi:PDR/VanB family oxidoreductase [Nocardioides stalactiti]|uniref:PDR/VanB family oxidoreductase n=1 Tax=Nocardioides stalactiti TaxID=2755356 RepID=UPI001603BF01|nr:PDR/VanB family oxidoreductase [Nocardioides stalactiti]
MPGLILAGDPVPDVALHPGVDLFVRTVDAYRAIAVSPLGRALTRPRPVRRTGFDQDLVVHDLRLEAEGVISLTLRAPDWSTLPFWRPGAHLDVFLPSGRQRQYSLCGDPDDPTRYRIAVRRIEDGGGGSREVHDDITVGDQLTVRGPRNAFRIAPASGYLFVAGGIGITPILPMVRTAHRQGVPWRLIYTARSRASMPFLDELARYRSGEVVVLPDDEHGIPDVAALVDGVAEGHATYLCGPPQMAAAAHRALAARGGRSELHTERFSARPVVDGTEFTARLARTGTSVTVAADETLLAAVRRARPDVTYSCQQGFCGTCKVAVLSGDVDHRDTTLLDSQRPDSMLVCVSRGTGELVLDL